MTRKYHYTFFLIASSLILFILSSCLKYRQDNYVKQIRQNLQVYDSINAALINRYAHRAPNDITLIYPADKQTDPTWNAFYDLSINAFCLDNKIKWIEVYSTTDGERSENLTVSYFLSERNHRYVFQNNGAMHKKKFENTRILVIPIDNRWTFEYVKPQW
jgi:hypothetical protein